MNDGGIFGAHAGEYLDAGLAPFPVNTAAKRPAVKGWGRASPGLCRSWASNPRLAASDGLGINMGVGSGIVEVDIDAEGEAWAALARDRFGDTPITIRTASDKRKHWFRHSGEGRHIRPFDDLPIDVLGAGFTIGPPSHRADNGAAYTFLTGSLDDIGRLPPLPAGALETYRIPAAAVRTGERNDRVFRWAMGQARFCDDVEALKDAVITWAGDFPDPLPLREVEAAARSAWRYEASGRNFVGMKRPQVSETDALMDLLSDHPDAFFLLSLFRRWHSNRPSFFIAARAMSAAGRPPWHYRRIERAREVLVSRGLIVEVRAPQRGGAPGLYRLARANAQFCA